VPFFARKNLLRVFGKDCLASLRYLADGAVNGIEGLGWVSHNRSLRNSPGIGSCSLLGCLCRFLLARLLGFLLVPFSAGGDLFAGAILTERHRHEVLPHAVDAELAVPSRIKIAVGLGVVEGLLRMFRLFATDLADGIRQVLSVDGLFAFVC